MTAEIGYFATMSVRPVKLADIFQADTPESAGRLILRSLPMHFATRIKHIEALPKWRDIPEIVDVRATLTQSFRNLRLLENQGSDLTRLSECIEDIRQRHKSIVPLLGFAMGEMRAEGLVNEAFASEWLHTFLVARISTEMLTLHYTLLNSGDDGTSGSCRGIVDSRCDPRDICTQVVEKLSQDPRFSAVPMKVESYVCGRSEKGIEFSFLPRYLILLVEELVKNSAWATMRACDAAPQTKAPQPVTIFVGADDRQVMIEISDKGGGIPLDRQDRIWCFASASDRDVSHSAEDVAPPRATLSWSDPLSGLGIKPRLGMGLPLTRLYTQYLGGSLELMSIPGVGVDAFINFRRIDKQSIDTLG